MKRLFAFAIVGLLQIGATAAVFAAVHNFAIDNRGHHTVIAIQISGVNRRSWGPNLLRSPLYADYHTSFSIGEGCFEDVLVTYKNRRQTTTANFNTCKFNLQLNY